MATDSSSISPRTIVEAFLPADGAVGLGVIYDTANAMGIDDQPLRLCLRRMVSAGQIEQTGRGRKGSVALTDAGRDRLRRDRLALRLAFAQDEGLVPWDGSWRLVAVSAPEAERSMRDATRRILVDAGAVSISTGLFISPHDLTDLLDTEQQRRIVPITASDISIGGTSDPRELAAMLWPPEPLLAGYEDLDRVLSSPPAIDLADAGAILRAQLILADAIERALRPDPLVPLELREADWKPTRLRREWRRRWDDLTNRLPDRLLYRDWLPSNHSDPPRIT
ncbi:PaaX family transcriptional regulator [Actinomyces slackii]|uniref:Phenylacetic acid-responsive transcriptional repressor n=1 Tax=Actinomyces slackii TaxID=52774 RepID=A0A448KF74_9ACTO|nr:PaaX family transcriptional regulator [Actinomyces slackii]VEG75627.1 Phenylacetic acid-responsive transcriptional repressor [Actinomyces slackii]